jgi:hypothetical protein
VTRALVVLGLIAACGTKDAGPPAQISDLSGSVDELRRDFDAHKNEARFVVLVAPT